MRCTTCIRNIFLPVKNVWVGSERWKSSTAFSMTSWASRPPPNCASWRGHSSSRSERLTRRDNSRRPFIKHSIEKRLWIISTVFLHSYARPSTACLFELPWARRISLENQGLKELDCLPKFLYILVPSSQSKTSSLATLNWYGKWVKIDLQADAEVVL